jgi:hypothetical protein
MLAMWARRGGGAVVGTRVGVGVGDVLASYTSSMLLLKTTGRLEGGLGGGVETGGRLGLGGTSRVIIVCRGGEESTGEGAGVGILRVAVLRGATTGGV